MKEYIEREAVCAACSGGQKYKLCSADCILFDVPAADVVEVVRCKDCRYTKRASVIEGYYTCGLLKQTVANDDYCSFGERREDA